MSDNPGGRSEPPLREPSSHAPYDAFLLVSFGGPERPEEVVPFLERAVSGKRVPRQRLEEVAEHYYHFGGRSPINAQNRELLAALMPELRRRKLHLAVYWGNRNWHPLLEDTVAQMADDGVRRAVALVTSAFGSYSGCRQYLEDIARAQSAAGEKAPVIDKLRLCFNHPGFIETMIERVRAAVAEAHTSRCRDLRLVFTAHSIPLSMAEASPYELQLREACKLTAEGAGFTEWELVFQSRSGPPQVPWLEPDVNDHLRRLARERPGTGVVLVPIGFISEHMEVLYDLDVEAAGLCRELGLPLFRAQPAGCHPRFVQMIAELVEERIHGTEPATVGSLPACPNVCPPDCCRVSATPR